MNTPTMTKPMPLKLSLSAPAQLNHPACRLIGSRICSITTLDSIFPSAVTQPAAIRSRTNAASISRDPIGESINLGTE